jgi:hypothetical protein
MVVVTHTGKLGDFLLSLPVASWIFRHTGEKIHWVLSAEFPPFRSLAGFLELQEMTGKVTLVPHHIRHYKCGGQPYKFDPAVYGVTDTPVYNIGFRYLPDKYVPDFYAEELGVGVDEDYRINVGGPRPDYAGKIVYVNDYGRLGPYMPPDAVELKPDKPLEVNIALALGAREIHCGFSGFAVAADLAGCPSVHVWKHGNPPPEPYYHRRPDRIHFYRIAYRAKNWTHE